MIVVLALGLIITLRAGEFDLSVATTMTIGSVVLAILDAQRHIGPGAAVALTLLLGAGIGLTNGILVVVFGVDSFIATLGTATILQGAALWLTNGETVVGLSDVFVNWTVINRFAGIPIEFYYAVVIMAVLAYVFRYTALGRRLLYVGKNREVARLSGIDVGRIKIGAFVTTAIMSAFAGILYAGTSGSANPSSGLSYLLPTYAAAFLGATTTVSGEFTPVGTLIAVYFLVSGVTGLAIIGLPSFVQLIFYGTALIVAVVGSKILASKPVA